MFLHKNIRIVEYICGVLVKYLSHFLSCLWIWQNKIFKYFNIFSKWM